MTAAPAQPGFAQTINTSSVSTLTTVDCVRHQTEGFDVGDAHGVSLLEWIPERAIDSNREYVRPCRSYADPMVGNSPGSVSGSIAHTERWLGMRVRRDDVKRFVSEIGGQ
jgi:hypothetical protein